MTRPTPIPALVSTPAPPRIPTPVRFPASPRVLARLPIPAPLVFPVLLILAAAACGDAQGSAPEHRWVSTSPDGVVEVSQAYAGESVTGRTAALYFALRNRGAVADTLEAVVLQGVGSARIHESLERDGARVMSPMTALPLPARGVTRLVPGGTHVMLLDLASRPVAGDSLVGVLRFRSGREVALRAVVHGLTDLEEIVGRSAG